MKKSEAEGNEIQRWTAKRKAAAGVEILKGKTTAADLARSHGLTVSQVEEWVDRFLSGGTEHLRAHPRDLEAQHQSESRDLHAKIGELTLEVDALKRGLRSQLKESQEGTS